jgi:hypothetical protein
MPGVAAFWVLGVSDGNAVRGFISWDMYAEWSEAEVGKCFLSRFAFSNVHSRL